jgi:hypothetical protein
MISRWVLHPFLIGLFPTLFLYAHNMHETALAELLAPSAVVFAVTLCAWGILRLLFKSPEKAGLVVSLFLILFFSAAVFKEWLDDSLTWITSFWIVRAWSLDPRPAMALQLALFVGLTVLIVWKLKKPGGLTAVANMFSLVLIGLPTATVLSALLHPSAASAQGHTPPTKRAPAVVETWPMTVYKPDIYYIILDGYARSDVMKELYGFDNEPFLSRLETNGFTVARSSHANYCQTPLCVASALNCRYLDPARDGSEPLEKSIKEMIGNNTVVNTLKKFGYKFVTFSTGFEQTEHPEADVYLTPNPQLSEFQMMLLSTTPLANTLGHPSEINPYLLSRKRTLYLLDKLPEIAQMPGPTFTFAHIVCPHPPFIFGEHGEDVSPYGKLYHLTDGNLFAAFYGDRNQYIKGYRNQATFITAQMELMINRILASSPQPPIIILQSDHGSGLGLDISSVDRSDVHERMSILNAYYLPEGEGAPIYETITPVNSFRIVLNKYFGAHLALLDDKSFYSTWEEPLNFTDVTDRVDAADERGSTAR